MTAVLPVLRVQHRGMCCHCMTLRGEFLTEGYRVCCWNPSGCACVAVRQP